MVEPGRSRIRELVVDDDELAVAVIASTLETAAIDAITMLSPIGATRAITEHDVSVVVVDVNMPTMQGDRIVSLLRGWERTKELPVVLISGSKDTLAGVKTALPGVETLTKDRLAKELVPLVKRLATQRRPAAAERASGAGSLGQSFRAECESLAAWHERVRERDLVGAENAEFARRLAQLGDEAALLGHPTLAEVATRARANVVARGVRGSTADERAAERRLVAALRAFAGDAEANDQRAFGELARTFTPRGKS